MFIDLEKSYERVPKKILKWALTGKKSYKHIFM